MPVDNHNDTAMASNMANNIIAVLYFFIDDYFSTAKTEKFAAISSKTKYKKRAYLLSFNISVTSSGFKSI